jgi:hypothetical protein
MIEIEQYEVGFIQTRLGVLSIALEKQAHVQWFPVRHVARALEVSEDRQVEVVKEHYAEALRMIPIKMAVGWRDVLCIRRQEMALWVAGINPKRCKLETREHLEAYRVELCVAADQLFWKHISLGSAQAHQPVEGAVVTLVADGVVYCEHGTPHKPVMRDGKLYIESLEE